MNIEGVNYEINWKKFKKGFSFFIPCNDAVVTRNNIAKITKRLKMSTTTKVVTPHLPIAKREDGGFLISSRTFQ